MRDVIRARRRYREEYVKKKSENKDVQKSKEYKKVNRMKD